MTQKFLEMENKYKLFETLQYKGIAYWHFIRMAVYMSVLKENEHLRDAHPDIEKKNWKQYFEFLKYIVKVAIKNIRFVSPKESILISCTSRKIYQDEQWINPLTYYISDQYKENCILFELSSLKDRLHSNKSTTNTFYSATWEINRILMFLMVRNIKDQNLELQIRTIKKYIKDFFDVEMDANELRREILYSVVSYRALYKKFNRFLIKNDVKCVVEVCHYNRKHMVLNMAAHDNNIKVIELQHGIMGHEHIAYNINYSDAILPDHILAFGQYWIDSIDYPDKEIKIITTGYPYFEKIQKKYNTYEKKNKIILFLSQGPFSDKMEEFAVSIYKRLKSLDMGYEVIYKLHPNEYETWKQTYKSLVQYPEIFIVDNDNKSLYEYFAMSTAQVGVNSTAIFEGLGFGLQTFILDIVKISFVDDLADKQIVRKVKTSAEVIDSLVSEKSGAENFARCKDYFWKDNSEANILRELDKMMKKSD